MAVFILAFLAVLAPSLVSASPVALDNTTLLANGQQAQILNSVFENLQVNEPCYTGETACINNAFAVCIDKAWQTQSCPSTKACFALPQIRTSGTFVACTSQRNAASIIAATGAQGGITCNSTSCSNITVPFPTVDGDSSSDSVANCGDDGDGSPAPDSSNPTQGADNSGNPDYGDNRTPSSLGPVTITVTLLPPTTTTISPNQASSLISSISANGLSPTPLPADGSPSSSNAPPVILLTAPPLTSFPTSSPSVRLRPTHGTHNYYFYDTFISMG